MDWDGCVADTVDWRINAGLAVAANVWPSIVPELLEEWSVALEEEEETTIVATTTNLDWFKNKLRALRHVLLPPPVVGANKQSSSSSSTTVEYALAARMLLEEQQLDDGQSIGKKGKYASRFHPSSSSSTSVFEEQQQQQQQRRLQRRGTRPLTVGEIRTNWGDIRDTLLMRYNRCGNSTKVQNPLPVLQLAATKHAVEESAALSSSTSSSSILPTIRPQIRELLERYLQRQQLKQKQQQQHQNDPSSSSNSNNVDNDGDATTTTVSTNRYLILSVSDASDLPLAERSLQEAAIPYFVCHNPRDAVHCFCNDNHDPSEGRGAARSIPSAAAIPLLVKNNNLREDDDATLASSASAAGALLKAVSAGSTVHVIRSSWPALQNDIYLFGDSIPRGPDGVAKSIFGDNNDSDFNHPRPKLSLRYFSLVSPFASSSSSSAASTTIGDDDPFQAAATMNPWTRLLSRWEDLEQLLQIEQEVPVPILREDGNDDDNSKQQEENGAWQ